MAEIRHFPQTGFQATWENVARQIVPAERPILSAEKYCVYNQFRERFVATGVEAVNASSSGAEAHLRSLEPGAGTGLWILPCAEISPTSIRFPVDLVFLNADSTVLAAVECFPLIRPPASSAHASSVLVLPESTVAAGEIRVGDRLIVCAPEEMKRHLQSMKDAKAEAQESTSPFIEPIVPRPVQEPSRGTAQGPAPSVVAPAPSAAFPESEAPPETLPATFFSQPAAPMQAAPAVAVPKPAAPLAPPPAKAEIAGPQTPAAVAPAPPRQTQAQPWKKKEGKNWFARLLQDEPVDPRNTSRESLPGLIAYFFTGGTPVAHPVRDISPTGMFIVTGERWYPGTVVRVTLTDRHNPTAERSITVNARAVRWANDGVGLEFILEERKQGKSMNAGRMERANGMDPEEVEEFLRLYKS